MLVIHAIYSRYKGKPSSKGTFIFCFPTGSRCAMHSRSAFLFLKIAGLIRTTNALSLLFSASSKDQVSDDAFNFQNINNVAGTAAIYTIDLSIAGQKFTVCRG